jgi:ribosomal protein L11 methyltransferase
MARPPLKKAAPAAHPLRQISLTTNALAEDALAALLEREFGQTPSSYTEAATGLVTVSVYWALPDREVTATKALLRAGLAEAGENGIPVQPRRITIRKVQPKDWSESWKRHFRPIEIGRSLLVKPTWSKRAPKAGQQVVLLDPGLSFGTGQHATTHFCLTQVAALRKAGAAQSFMDMGTGSGILAIAAAKLGYTPVRAFDFDPDCVRITAENAGLNGVAQAVNPELADVTKLPRKAKELFDVVCANLICDLLIAERDRILARLKPGGSLVLAGILATQFAEVSAAFGAAGWKLVKAKTDKEWRSGLFRRG